MERYHLRLFRSEPRARCTWINMHSRLYQDRPAFWRSETMAASHGTIKREHRQTRQRDPTWFNMDTGINTIEFYSGDISGNFAMLRRRKQVVVRRTTALVVSDF